jgi:hypothetical protein
MSSNSSGYVYALDNHLRLIRESELAAGQGFEAIVILPPIQLLAL